MPERRDFTPALGPKALTPLYDAAIALATRERRWRRLLVEAIDLRDGERLLDVGCGTGSLLAALALQRPQATLVGLDPDDDVLKRARAKHQRINSDVVFEQGFLDAAFVAGAKPFDVVVSSLVLHQTSLSQKSEILRRMRQVLRSGGRLCVADYGLQATAVMRTLFRVTVQALDGVEDTQPNADGALPRLMAEAGFEVVDELARVNTATGSISIWTAR